MCSYACLKSICIYFVHLTHLTLFRKYICSKYMAVKVIDGLTLFRKCMCPKATFKIISVCPLPTLSRKAG